MLVILLSVGMAVDIKCLTSSIVIFDIKWLLLKVSVKFVQVLETCKSV